MKEYVVDASVAIKWVVLESQSEAAEAYLPYQLYAPDFLLIECASILFKKYLTGHLEAEKAFDCLQEVVDSGVALHAPDMLIARALKLSAELRHSVYDCLYLALALQEDIPLVTADEKFYKTVRKHAKLKHIVELL